MNQKANFKTVTLKDLWGVFVQRLWAIILAACICCGGFLVFNRMTFVPQYASTATLYILRQADGATASDAQDNEHHNLYPIRALPNKNHLVR